MPGLGSGYVADFAISLCMLYAVPSEKNTTDAQKYRFISWFWLDEFKFDSTSQTQPGQGLWT